MQEGLGFLWLLSLIASAAAWLYREVVLAGKKGIASRSQMAGCELARKILDTCHLTHTAVQPAPSRGPEPAPHRDELLLNEKIYSNSSLAALAETLHETVHWIESSKVFLSTRPGGMGGRFFSGWVLLSWTCLALGVLFSHWVWLFRLGQFLFVLAFLAALASLAGEWEIGQRAVSQLTALERLGTDERVRMKEVLKALRWTPLAEIFRIPIQTLFRLRLKWKRETNQMRAPL